MAAMASRYHEILKRWLVISRVVGRLWILTSNTKGVEFLKFRYNYLNNRGAFIWSVVTLANGFVYRVVYLRVRTSKGTGPVTTGMQTRKINMCVVYTRIGYNGFLVGKLCRASTYTYVCVWLNSQKVKLD